MAAAVGVHVGQQSADYVVGKDGSTYYAIKTATGKIEYSGADASTVLQAVIAALTSWVGGPGKGKVFVQSAQYDLATPIDFPEYYGEYATNGIIIEGTGRGTVFNYTGTSDWAFKFSVVGAGAATACDHWLRDCVVIADAITDGAEGGCVLFEGGGNCGCDNVAAKSTYGKVFRFKKNDVGGSWSMLNTLRECRVEDVSKYTLYGTDYSQVYCDHCNFTKGTVDCIYWDGGLLWLAFTQVRGTVNALNVKNAVATMIELYNDGGDAIFDNCYVTMLGYSGKFSPTSTTVWQEINARNIGHLYFDYPIIQAPQGKEVCFAHAHEVWADIPAYGTTVVDATASDGFVNQNTAPTTPGFVFLHGWYYYHYLPRGRYLVLVRLKDTGAVANDCQVVFKNFTDGTLPLVEVITLTTAWKTYAFNFTIDANDGANCLQFYIFKLLATSNTISADFYRMIWLGPEFDDYSIGGGTQLIKVADIASLPTPTVTYRGMLAFVQGGGGVADVIYVCRKAAGGSYEWLAL